jgi:hypothetical protein
MVLKSRQNGGWMISCGGYPLKMTLRTQFIDKMYILFVKAQMVLKSRQNGGWMLSCREAVSS